MYTRLNDVPALKVTHGQVKALHYNHVQIALKRIGNSIRFRIPGLKHLDLILEQHAWIIVERALNDIPVAAWTNFMAQRRKNLHEPVPCHLKLYHANARLILQRTLEAMELLLGEQLAEESDKEKFNVLPFPPR